MWEVGTCLVLAECSVLGRDEQIVPLLQDPRPLPETEAPGGDVGPTGWEATGVRRGARPAHTAQCLCLTTCAGGPSDASLQGCRAPQGNHTLWRQPQDIAGLGAQSARPPNQISSGGSHVEGTDSSDATDPLRGPPHVPITRHSGKALCIVSNRQPIGSGLNSRFISYTVSSGG